MSDVTNSTSSVAESVNLQQNHEDEFRVKRSSVRTASHLAFNFQKAVDPVVKEHEAKEANVLLELWLHGYGRTRG